MPQKEKKTIVFIHGNSSSSKVFENTTLKEELDVNFVFIDLPGHGSNQNENYSAQDFSIESYKKFVIDKISEIKTPILLVGNSLGGHIAIEIADEIENLKGLVVFGTPPVKHPINFEEAFTQSVDLSSFLEEQPEKELIKEIVGKVVFNKDKVNFFIKDFYASNPKVRTATKVDLFENKFADEYKTFTQLNIPKFIIIGENDPTVNHQYINNVKDNCINFCELIYFENCGHYPSYEQPEQFYKTLVEIANKVF